MLEAFIKKINILAYSSHHFRFKMEKTNIKNTLEYNKTNIELGLKIECKENLIDSATRENLIDVLDWWKKNSNLKLIYSENAIVWGWPS